MLHYKGVIGFDLDGVLVPDIIVTPEALKARVYMKPLFIPRHDFIIVTSRPQQDYQATIEWEYIYMKNVPSYKGIFCENNLDVPSLEYKIEMLKLLSSEQGLEVYFESSVKDSIEITSAVPKLRVICWRNFISNILDKL